MTLSNEQRRLKYKNDEAYRNKILTKGKQKYHNDEEFRNNKIKSSIQYSKDHPVYKSEYLKRYYKDNSDDLKRSIADNRNNKRYEVLYWYSNGLMECEMCGEKHFEFLCIDHIDDNGSEHRVRIGTSNDMLNNWIIKNNFPFGFQTLCNNCNYLKEYHRINLKPLSQSKYAVATRKQRLNIKMQTFYWYSNGDIKCDCCGERNLELLTIDHINGGGKQHVKDNKIKHLYEYLYYNNYPEGYRLLCWNCNKSYGQYGYCPHNYSK